MARSGCVFDRRGRFCRRLPGTDEISPECEVLDGRCSLRGALAAEPAVAVSRPPVAPPGGRQIRVSGPVSIASAEFEGRRYLLLGDLHRSMAGTCLPPCADFDLETGAELGDESADCYDISRLLAAIFERRRAVDFYLEIPFLPRVGPIPGRATVRALAAEAGYLYKLFAIFWACFAKRAECPYASARFHYVDVRLGYEAAPGGVLAELQRRLAAMNGPPPTEAISTRETVFEQYATHERIMDGLLRLQIMATTGNFAPDEEIELTDRLLTELYSSRQTLTGGPTEPKAAALFRLYLTSDNFSADVRALFADLLRALSASQRDEITARLINPALIVRRNGREMHRVRAQLWALVQAGRAELAERIVAFILGEYRARTNPARVLGIWRAIWDAYRAVLGTTGARVRSMADIRRGLDDIERRLGELQDITLLGVTTTSLLLDAYTLGRMFRPFPGPSEMAIVYAGQAHVETIGRFFETALGVRWQLHNPNADLLRRWYERPESVDIGRVTRCIEVGAADVGL